MALKTMEQRIKEIRARPITDADLIDGGLNQDLTPGGQQEIAARFKRALAKIKRLEKQIAATQEPRQ
jgi:hypothetical protein